MTQEIDLTQVHLIDTPKLREQFDRTITDLQGLRDAFDGDSELRLAEGTIAWQRVRAVRDELTLVLAQVAGLAEYLDRVTGQG